MLHENDKILIQSLHNSFCCQLECYNTLRDVVRQLMSRLVLSRGDLSKLVEGFQKKKVLIDKIENERFRVAQQVEQWQQRKAHIGTCETIERFEQTLQKVTDAIQHFLNDEEQLQKYLEGVVARTGTPTTKT